MGIFVVCAALRQCCDGDTHAGWLRGGGAFLTHESRLQPSKNGLCEGIAKKDFCGSQLECEIDGALLTYSHQSSDA